MPDTKAAKDAVEKTAKDVEVLYAKRALENAGAGPEVQPEPTKPAVSDPAPGETKPAERARKIRARGKLLYETFTGPELGLMSTAAATLTAHLLLTHDKPEDLGRTQALAVARGFMRQYPIVWGSLRVGNVIQFMLNCRRAGLATGDQQQLTEAINAIR